MRERGRWIVRRIVSKQGNKGEIEMKHCKRYIGSALVVAGTLAAGLALAEDKSSAAKADPKAEEMMKKMEVAGTPGAAHKALDALVGRLEYRGQDVDGPGRATHNHQRNGKINLGHEGPVR